MENKERKYQQYGKFEDLLVKIEDEIQNGMRALERDKQDLFYEMRIDTEKTKNNVMTGENRSVFARKVRELIENSERSASNRDGEFSKEIMKKLVGVLKENVPGENYENVDMKDFILIAEQMENKLQKELEEKEKANDGGFGGRVENGHFKKIKRDFDRHVGGVLTREEMREVRLYVERMYDYILQLGERERTVREVTITSVVQEFDDFIKQQRDREQMKEAQSPAVGDNNGKQNQISPELNEALNNAPDPLGGANNTTSTQISQETIDALNNAPDPLNGITTPKSTVATETLNYEMSPFDYENQNPKGDGSGLDELAGNAFEGAPVVNLDDETMETIAPPPVQQPAVENSTKETMEGIAPKKEEKDEEPQVIERDGCKYVVSKEAVYGDNGELITPGELRTLGACSPEELKKGHVVLNQGTYNMVLTLDEYTEMIRAIDVSHTKPHNIGTGEMDK